MRLLQWSGPERAERRESSLQEAILAAIFIVEMECRYTSGQACVGKSESCDGSSFHEELISRAGVCGQHTSDRRNVDSATVFLLLMIFARGFGLCASEGSEQAIGQSKVVLAEAVGEQPVVRDANEAFGSTWRKKGRRNCPAVSFMVR